MSYQLTIEPIGATVDIEEGQTVLDACLRAGVWLPHACGHGLCATCKVQVVDGDFEHGEASPFALMDFERDERKILACCATVESDMVIEAEVDEDPDAQFIGLQDFTGRVVKADMLTPTIRGIWLEVDTPVQFQAGQYIMLKVPGVQGERAFSIGNAPGTNQVELHIRKVPGGAATTWLHDELKVGDSLEFTAPLGRFFTRKSANLPMIFLAGGSGLSSPKAMIEELFNEGCTLPITLVQGARNEAELYYHNHFAELAAQHPNFTYIPALSDTDVGDNWTGAKGFVHEALKAHFNNDFRGHKAYMCGPPPMIEACISTLMQGQLFERDIYTERFLTSADAEGLAKKSPLFKHV